MMAHQRVAGGGAIALHHVEHASRDPGFQRQLAQTIGGQRRQLGHFQHRGIPSARHGATFQVAVTNGTFHGDTSAQTPTGCTRV